MKRSITVAGQPSPVETWQVYGLGGALIAEYAQNGSASTPQKEYGYRNGQLLVTATVTTGWGTAPTLNDNPLTVGQTTVQARHITELRAAIDALRTHMGMSAYSWQYSATTNDYISANPILEMRTALDQALGAPSGGYSAGLAQNQLVMAIHIQELRNRVLAAWQSGSGVDIRWMVSDQLGTPRMIFDQSGSLATVSRHDYLPFGEELFAGTGGRTTAQGYTSSDGVRQHFTQKERDNETGLDYFGARYFASTQGRFTGVDPIAMASNRIMDPQQLNLYEYARNNPMIFVDPNGKELEAVIYLSAVTGRNEIGFLDDRVVGPFNGFVSHLENDLDLEPRFNYLFRTTDEQQRLYDNRGNNPNPVAVPGTSPHESGLAFDINRNGPHGLTGQGLGLDALRAEASNFGWYPIPSGGDPPHLQYPGIVPISGRDASYLAPIAENQQSYRRFVSLNNEFYGTQSISRGRGETDLQLWARVSFLNQINRMDAQDRRAGHPRRSGEQPRGMQVPPRDFIERRRRGQV